MPIRSCTLPDGGKGYKWGDSGKCYRNRKDAERQASAAYANGYAGDEALIPPGMRAVMPQDLIVMDRRPSARLITADGHLRVAGSAVSKSNVCPYLGAEIPGWQQLGLDAGRIYRLYRDPKALAAAADSLNGKPLLVVHRPLTAQDHDHRVVVGALDNAHWQAPYLRADLTVWTQDAIDLIESGEQRQLSCAYRYTPVMRHGVTADGEPYDGYMADIHFNHCALVSTGRAGADVMVGDSLTKGLLRMATGQASARLSRKAVMVAGAVQAYIHPKLATDQKPDLRRALLGTTAANYTARKPVLAARLHRALSGKLAKDASLAEIVALLDRLEGDDTAVGTQPDPDPDDDGDVDVDLDADDDDGARTDPPPDDDASDVTPAGSDIPPEVAEAAAENIDPDIENPDAGDMPPPEEVPDSDDVTAPPPDAGPAGEVTDKVLTFLNDLIRPEDLAIVTHLLKPNGSGSDPEPKSKLTVDKPAFVTKQAMDAAIKAATKATEQATIARLRAVSDARAFIRPWVGELNIAQDSAEGVLRAALEHLGVDVKDVHPSAYKAILSAQPRPGERQRGAPRALAHAADAKPLSFEERFPHANRLRAG
jgi:hypothetical protein